MNIFWRIHLKFFYGLWSLIYDDHIDHIFSFDRKQVIDQLNLFRGAKVLEVGVGTGLNLPFYPPEVKVVGVDISLAMLKEAHKKNCPAKLELIESDACDLNLPPHCFSHALATFVFRVAPKPIVLLDEVSRLITPDGTLVILDQFKPWNWFLSPLKALVGWGKDFEIDELLAKSKWTLIKKNQVPNMKHTYLLVLRNNR